METIESRVKAVLSEQLNQSVDDIKPEHRIVEDLGGDSLDQVEIVMYLEDEFGIDITDEDADRFTTVQDVIDYLAKHATANA